jgi:flagellin
MIINHNLSAVNAHRSLKFNEWQVDNSMAKLSSGLRINRAGDDASGLAVSEKMRAQVGGLRQAERNTEDGMSLIQTAEGYLEQSSNIVQRIRVLAIQSSNGIYSPEDRTLMQVEVSALVDEIDRIASQAEFNRFKLLNGDFATGGKASMWFHMGPNMNQRRQVFVGTMTAAALGMRDNGKTIIASISTPEKANTTIGLMNQALDSISKQRADLGAYYNRLEKTAMGLMSAFENVQASESRIRDADMAEEMVEYTKASILTRANTAMLAQASLKPRAVLPLLEMPL